MSSNSAKGGIKRKVIAAREDLVNSLLMLAKKRGATLYALINEIIEQALRADSLGTSLREVLDVYEFLKANRNSGQTLVPIEVLNTLIAKIPDNLKEELEKIWLENGKWYGEYLTIKFRMNTSDKDKFVRFLERVLRETRWEFTEVSIQFEDEGLRIRCVSLVLTPETTKLLAKFIEGMMNAYNYRLKRSEIYRGIIDLLFESTTQ